MSETTCSVQTCDRPADGGFVCRSCTHALEQVLAEVPWLVDELNLVITKQTRYSASNGGNKPTKASEVPLPVNLRASDVLNLLSYRLASWSLLLVEENPHWTMPRQHPADTSAWLLCRLETIRHHGAGGDLVEELCDVTATARYTIDRPKEKQFLGRCQDQNHAESGSGGDLRAERTTNEPTCPGNVYGRSGAYTAVCDECGTEWDAAALRTHLIASLEDKLCSASEIAKLSTYLGLTIGRDQVRNRINQWHKRGRLSRSLSDKDGAPLFRFSDAMILLEQHNAQRVGA